MPAVPGARMPSRRHLLRVAAAGLAGLAGRPARASRAPGPLVVLDFAAAQSLLALGVEVFGLAERWRYARAVEEPRLSGGVFDIGTFAEPNLELLAEVRPRLIVHAPEWPTNTGQLARIAPLMALPIYTGAPDPLPRARSTLLQLAEITSRETAAAAYGAGFARQLDALRGRLTPFEGLPVMVLWAETPRSFWTLGTASLVHDVLTRLGLRNVIGETGDIWGWLPVATRELAAQDGPIVLHFGPLPDMLATNPFWNTLSFVRLHRLVVVPRSWLFGGLPEAERIALHVTQALEGADHLSRS